MAKMPKQKSKLTPKLEDVELEPDAWERFEGTMDKIVPPKPHKTVKAKPPKPKPAK